MIRVQIDQADIHLSELAAQARAGEEIVLMKGDEPVAKIVGIMDPKPVLRQPGRFKGVFELDDCFFEPLPDEELEAWNNPA